MVQPGENVCLALEPSSPLGIRGESVWQDVDRHVAPQLGVTRAKHLAHPAGPEHAGHFVGAYASADADHGPGFYSPACLSGDARLAVA